jgi:hypothetical protein
MQLRGPASTPRAFWHYVGVRGVALVITVLALSGSAAATTGSGLYGKVSRGPVTPVCVAERPCSRPAAGTTLEFVRRGAVAAHVVTARDGTYRVPLQAGVYLVKIATSTTLGRRIDPTSVRVAAAAWSRQNFSIDSGIR